MSVINVQRIRSVHRLNAILLAAFIVVHFSVNLSAWGGAERHALWRDTARGLYQHNLVEAVLIIAILSQVASGLWHVRRRKRLDISAVSGLYLAMFLLVHGSVTIGTRRFTDLDTDYFWASGSLAFGLLGVGFALYYALAVISVTVHLGTALRRGWRIGPKAIWAKRYAALIGITLAAALLLPFSPFIRDQPITPAVQDYYGTNFGWTGQVPPR